MTDLSVLPSVHFDSPVKRPVPALFVHLNLPHITASEPRKASSTLITDRLPGHTKWNNHTLCGSPAPTS
jgi:hypothetical protein